MTQDDQTAQLQTELTALKRQMRQLLEVVALVQEKQGVTPRSGLPTSYNSSELGLPQGTGTHGEQAAMQRQLRDVTPTSVSAAGSSDERQSAASGPIGARIAEAQPNPPLVPIESYWATALLEENKRLAELTRTQAEEIGVLRERILRVESSSHPDEAMGNALRLLLRALRDAR